MANGVALEGFGPAHADLLAEARRLTSRGVTFYLVKAFLYVLPDASPQTEIAIETPAQARLFYTDIRTWSSRPSDAEIIAGSGRAFTVESCPGRTGGYPGGLLVPGRGCVTLLVERTATTTRQDVTVSIGLARC